MAAGNPFNIFSHAVDQKGRVVHLVRNIVLSMTLREPSQAPLSP